MLSTPVVWFFSGPLPLICPLLRDSEKNAEIEDALIDWAEVPHSVSMAELRVGVHNFVHTWQVTLQTTTQFTWQTIALQHHHQSEKTARQFLSLVELISLAH